MTTLASSSLPIPDSVIVGTGSYVIPANKYGYLTATATATFYGASNSSNPSSLYGLGMTSGSNSNEQWVAAGDTVTVLTSFPSISQSNFNYGTVCYALIRLNGVNFCAAYGGGMTSTTSYSGAILLSSGVAGWSVSLYRIPKGNLPIGAAEGE